MVFRLWPVFRIIFWPWDFFFDSIKVALKSTWPLASTVLSLAYIIMYVHMPISVHRAGYNMSDDTYQRVFITGLKAASENATERKICLLNKH